jgi:hypothetical protein
MDTHSLIASILRCGTLDANYLIRLMSANELTPDGEFPQAESWNAPNHLPDGNSLIYAAYENVAQNFLEHVVKQRASRFTTTEYTIIANYIDSNLWFDDKNLNRWYEAWRAF